MNQQTLLEPEVLKTAELSGCGTYRWTLGRQWADGPQICWVMLNPSTADHTVDDPTIRRCINFSRQWGYGRLVVVNLYPFRSSSPDQCRRWADWETSRDWYVRDAIHHQNLPRVLEQTQQSQKVVAAWGNVWDPAYAEHICEEIQCEGGHDELFCLGTTKSGSPRHPLYVRADKALEPWSLSA